MATRGESGDPKQVSPVEPLFPQEPTRYEIRRYPYGREKRTAYWLAELHGAKRGPRGGYHFETLDSLRAHVLKNRLAGTVVNWKEFFRNE